MASITAATTHRMKKPVANKGRASVAAKKAAAANNNKQRGWAPPLKVATFVETGSVALDDFLNNKDEAAQQTVIRDLFQKTVLGESTVAASLLGKPHAASTTHDRGAAAADLAVLAKRRGLRFVLKECGIYAELQKVLFPNGIQAVLKTTTEDPPANNHATTTTTKNASSSDAEDGDDVLSLNVGLKPSRSAVSLTSLDDATSSVTSGNNQTTSSLKRGKTTPANAREGCLLLLRALCEIVGAPQVEPYVVGGFLAASLDECASSAAAVRQAAQDASLAICNTANAWSLQPIVKPLLLQTLQHTTEWRCKAACLECLQHLSRTQPAAMQRLIPTLLPPLASQVWDTKPQVAKAAKSALLSVCQTNVNPDIETAIPAVVNAICKPTTETNHAISQLMGTTFVVPVNASTLAILCPVLARGLKEKLAVHKRAACLVISNMSKLVEHPKAVAPFGSLLVPELQKVCQNVQFQEIRDEALKALANLTKALGDWYKASSSSSSSATAATAPTAEDEGETDDAATNAANNAANAASAMEAEQERVQAEQARVQAERQAAEQRQLELQRQEEEERLRFKEAMNAQRELEKLEAQKAAQRKREEQQAREKSKLSTKSTAGKCQACGLKKCKKSCMFYNASKK